MARSLAFSPEAREDLRALAAFIAEAAGAGRATGYLRRTEAACRSPTDFPHRGARRDDLHPGLRVLGLERRVAIAFVVREDSVRILCGGRGLEAASGASDPG